VAKQKFCLNACSISIWLLNANLEIVLKCTGMHCDILHIDVNEKPSDDNPNVEGISGTLLTSYATTRTNSDLNSETLLSTALLNVEDAYGKPRNARALLDTASQLSFITEVMAKGLI
jgi:hypothetical protein